MAARTLQEKIFLLSQCEQYVNLASSNILLNPEAPLCCSWLWNETIAWPSATEPFQDPRKHIGKLIYHAVWWLACLLQVPFQIFDSTTFFKALTRPAWDRVLISKTERQGGCSLGHHNITSGSWNRIEIEKCKVMDIVNQQNNLCGHFKIFISN